VIVDPAVSVIIPTYQRRHYVSRAVQSVLRQTFTDFELIVVDDGSSDGTAEALGRYGDGIRYRWQPNGGLSAARNAGIGLARGDIVAFLDSDDQFLPDHLAVVTEALARHPEAVLVSTCPRSHVAGREKARDARLVDALPLSLLDHVAGLVDCIAVRREDLVALGGFNEEMRVAQDVELWLRLAARGPFSFVQRRTVVRQYTQGSLEELGGERGDYLHDLDVIARTGIYEVGRLQRADRRELAARAEGKARYVAALGALVRRDETAVHTALRDACRALPELAHECALVAKRLELLSPKRGERAYHFATVARLWPDPTAETALFLRGRAIIASFLAGRPSDALALAAGWPWRANPVRLARTFAFWGRLARRNLQRLIHRGREGVD
jgi:glycosyltransferase involved in cell wall biosynthesis